MAEFSGIPPAGLNSIVRPAPVAPPPAVPTIEAGLKGGGLSGRMSSDARTPPSERFSDRQGRDARADPDQHPGPSPAFQASVLELELDLQNAIARIEAARGKRESDMAGVTNAGSGRDTGKATQDTNRPAATAQDADAPEAARKDATPRDPAAFEAEDGIAQDAAPATPLTEAD